MITRRWILKQVQDDKSRKGILSNYVIPDLIRNQDDKNWKIHSVLVTLACLPWFEEPHPELCRRVCEGWALVPGSRMTRKEILP